MLSQVTFNKEKWIAAMMLDPVTGLDPPDAKVRAAEGIDAASSLVQGYWIWCVTYTVSDLTFDLFQGRRLSRISQSSTMTRTIYI